EFGVSIVELARLEPAPGPDPAPPATRATRVPGWVLVTLVAIGAALRLLWSTTFGLSFDETFTAMAGRRSLGNLFDFLSHQDSHPPLDYLLRLPLARAGAGDLAFRAPSVVFSVAALALFAWWMRDRGWAGAVATGLLAVSGFEIAYGGEARMYALLQLIGIAVAVIAEAWLVTPRRWHTWAVGGLVFVGLCDHVSVALLAVGLFALAGIRRDRAAWRWRAGVVAGGVGWAAVWGTSFLTQARVHHPSWIPLTTLDGVLDVVAGHVTYTDGVRLVVLAAIAAGAVCLARRGGPLFQVWVVCGVVPFALAATVGVFTPFFLDRTVTAEAWAPVLAVGFLVDAAARRWRPLGITAAVAVVLVALPGTLTMLGGTWFYDLTIEQLGRSARPGDVVAVTPAWYGPLTDWRVGVRSEIGPATPSPVPIDETDSFRLTGARATGRVWLVEYGSSRPSLAGYVKCGPTWTHGETTLLCLEPRQPHPE
ncbi:MAG: mannosyltransferase, partial [Actinomycetota bacterium]|nr:mannosyltransferase [Actinomycetota bacterium]